MSDLRASGGRRDNAYVRRTAARYKQEYDWADEDAIRISVALNACYNAERLALGRFYDSRGVGRTAGRFTLLRALYFSEGHTMTPADLASELMVTQANVSYLLDGLEREGLLSRIQGEHDDKRLVNVVLTQSGKSLCDHVVPDMPGFLASMASGFEQEEKEQFLGFLLRYLSNAAQSYAAESVPPSQ